MTRHALVIIGFFLLLLGHSPLARLKLSALAIFQTSPMFKGWSPSISHVPDMDGLRNGSERG